MKARPRIGIGTPVGHLGMSDAIENDRTAQGWDA
jgi:hypothetical protein